MPLSSRAVALVGLVASLCACDRTPDHRLEFMGRGELGAVRITEQTLQRIEVENTGREPVTLESLAFEAGHAGVLTIDADTTGCMPGLTLAVAERCSVGVVFEPANDVTYSDSLRVDYRPEAGTEPLRATLRVSGVGLLDCSVRPEFARSFEEGVAEAEARIALDVVEATAAGEALTDEDGFDDGYASTFDAAYDRAYDPGYDEGRAEGYGDGYADGASAAVCREAERDGRADGADAGLGDGDADGFADGDAAGYDDGYADGRYDGENDSCGYVAKIDLDPTLPGKCVDQGYAATYSRAPYDAAYAAAVAANTAYLAGVSRGEREGTLAGRDAGHADGYADGYRDGAELGVVDGDADRYESCYRNAFDDAYDDGYADGYDGSLDDGYAAGYSDGYEDGYASGFLICDY